VESGHPTPIIQRQPLPIIVLMMSRVLLDFGEVIVTQVYLAFSNRLYKKDQRIVHGVEIYDGFGEKHTIAKELVHDVREIVGICKDVAQVIIINLFIYIM